MKIKIHGEFVALRQRNMEEEVKGGIAIPQGATKTHEFGVVVAVGSPKFRDPNTTKPEIPLKEGDLVWFQVAASWAQARTSKIRDVSVMLLNYSDIICRLTNGKMHLEYDNVEPLGSWSLMQGISQRPAGSKIVIPETVTRFDRDFLFKVLKKGERVTQLNVADTAICDARYTNPVKLGQDEMFYVDSPGVLAVVEGEPENTELGSSRIVGRLMLP